MIKSTPTFVAKVIATEISHLRAPGARIVDIGCGEGLIAGKLASLGYQVIGVDVDKVGEHNGARLSGLTFVNRHIADCIADLGDFDVALLVYSSHHMLDSLQTIAAACRRAEASIVIVDVFTGSRPVDWLPTRTRMERTKSSWLSWLRFLLWRGAWRIDRKARLHAKEDILSGRVKSITEWKNLLSIHDLSMIRPPIILGDTFVFCSTA